MKEPLFIRWGVPASLLLFLATALILILSAAAYKLLRNTEKVMLIANEKFAQKVKGIKSNEEMKNEVLSYLDLTGDTIIGLFSGAAACCVSLAMLSLITLSSSFLVLQCRKLSLRVAELEKKQVQS